MTEDLQNFRPRRVDDVHVYSEFSPGIVTEDFALAGEAAFRLFDPSGRIVLHGMCDEVSSKDPDSPLSPLNGAMLIAVELRPCGQCVDLILCFDNGYRMEWFEADVADSFRMCMEGKQIW